MSHDPETVERQVIDQRMQESQRAVNVAFDALVSNVPNAKLPETIFKEYFLPYFAGKVIPNERDDRAAQWIGIAGNPTREVDLIDNSGKVVLTVPSLFDTHSLNPLRPADRIPKGQKSTHEMLLETKLRDNHIRGSGQAFFQRNMDLRVDQIIENGGIGEATHSDSATTQKWGKVFKHFGLTQADGNSGNSSQMAPKASGDDIPDFDYGD